MVIYRPDVPMEQKEYSVFLHRGGVGDLLSQLPAVKYVLDYHKHINLTLWAHDYAQDFLKKVFAGYSNINITDLKNVEERLKGKQTITRSPYLHKVNNLANPFTDHAFMTIVGTVPENKYKNYIKLDPVDVSHFNLPKDYAVFTTGYTSPVREWKFEYMEEVANYCTSKGVIPVFLGKDSVKATDEVSSRVNFGGQVDRLGVNLLNKTSLFEAHSIIAGAKVAIGVDNGLVPHLAAMTDTHIIAGFTTVNPMHRLPYRNDIQGHNITAIYPSDKELACIGCQSNMNFAEPTHKFTTCYYNDMACLDLIKPELFIEALKKVGI